MDHGLFGIINTLIPMSTSDTVKLAQWAGARQAAYMDTGIFDTAVIFLKDKSIQHLGRSGFRKSTNLLGIYLQP
jgi:hypothetical protein